MSVAVPVGTAASVRLSLPRTVPQPDGSPQLVMAESLTRVHVPPPSRVFHMPWSASLESTYQMYISPKPLGPARFGTMAVWPRKIAQPLGTTACGGHAEAMSPAPGWAARRVQ